MILLTGSTGLLGKYLMKYFNNIDMPSHEEMDITKVPLKPALIDYDLIIHAAAYTDVVKAETEREKCFDTNVIGTMNMIAKAKSIPFVFISTEYAHNPQNYYSLTKAFAEDLIKHFGDRYLIIRTLFKPSPFPFEKAFIDQYTQGDYVPVIAALIAAEIKRWDRRTSKTIYVGTGRKTIYDLAKITKPDVGKMSVDDVKEVKLPKDYEDWYSR
jgi:dTDP-4-dehydrorhamnose reductase